MYFSSIGAPDTIPDLEDFMKMAYLYGSSNVYRFYKNGVDCGLSTLSSLTLVECTRQTVLDAHVSDLASPKFIVTSVLENFVCDACAGGEGYELFGNQVITRHVEFLSDLVSKWPGLIVAIVPPILRSKPAWFATHLPQFNEFLAAEVSRVRCPGMKLFCPFVVSSDMLIPDLVHLTPAAGIEFIDYLEREISSIKFSFTEAVSSAAMDDEVTMIETLSSDEEVEETLGADLSMDEKLNRIFAAVSGSSTKVKKLKSRIEVVAKAHSQLDGRLVVRRKQDNLVFARLKEEADYETNRSREDRVVITGLAALKKVPSTHKEKKEHYSALITALVKLAVPGLEPPPSVLDVYLTVTKGRAQPVVEARLDSVSGAIAFRTESAKLAKENSGKFAGLFFTNSATLATRVRIEIIRAIALKLTTNTEDAYVQGFISRPLLHYRSQDPANRVAGGADRSYTFVDAVSRFGDLLFDSDLTASYARAGHTFAGAMEHYFVVLGEGHVVPPRPIPGSSRGRGRFSGRTRGGRKRFGDALETPSKKNNQNE